MTEDLATSPIDSTPGGRDHASTLFAQWAVGISYVLTQITGKEIAVRNLQEPAADQPQFSEDDHQAIVTAGGGLRGEMSIRTPPRVLLAVAQLFLGAKPDPTASLNEEHREAYAEFLRQVAGHVATGLKPLCGEVQLRVDTNAGPAWPPAQSAWLTSTGETTVVFWFSFQLSAALNACLLAMGKTETSATPPRTEDEVTTSADGNLKMLLDVELNITLRFGGRRMRLRDILELGAGSVVELDRGVVDPAELLLDGRLIARGEVVIVDGNYGLRVLEVIPAVCSLPAVGGDK